MVQAALYILIGIAFYGGGHQLYLGARGGQDHPHVIHAGMYFLLAVFALLGEDDRAGILSLYADPADPLELLGRQRF